MLKLAKRCFSSPTEAIDCVVIGAGAIGLAVARSLAQEQREVLVLEREGHIGTGISSRNSEVIHAGIYYKEDSLKAALCVEGKRMLYKYCQEKGIQHKQCGKLIVATNSRQLGTLEELLEQGKANGVDDLEKLDRSDVRLLEPAIRCTGAVLSPSSGIFDSHHFLQALQADAEAAGATFSFGSEVVGGDVSSSIKKLDVRQTDGGETSIFARNVVNAGGLYAWQIAGSFQGYSKQYMPNQYYARGCYFTMTGRAPFTRLVYPIPEPGGLGIHLTLDLQGKTKFGPDVEWIDEIDYTINPTRAKEFYSAIRTYYPDLKDGSLIPDYAGIRPKNAGPNEPAADFIIQTHQSHVILGLTHLFGIESPGLTASLAIGEYVAEILDS